MQQASEDSTKKLEGDPMEEAPGGGSSSFASSQAVFILLLGNQARGTVVKSVYRVAVRSWLNSVVDIIRLKAGRSWTKWLLGGEVGEVDVARSRGMFGVRQSGSN